MSPGEIQEAAKRWESPCLRCGKRTVFETKPAYYIHNCEPACGKTIDPPAQQSLFDEKPS